MSFRLLKSLAKKLSRRELNSSLAEFVKSIPSGSKVLNIGSGGEIMNVINANLQNQDIEVLASDIDEDRKPDIVDDIVNTKLTKNSFDYIIMAEVLEHVKEPKLAVENLHKVLKKNGGCFISTPYLFPTHDAPYDFFRYTEYGLKHLFSKFEIVDFKGKTSWWETLLLLAWRVMWVGCYKSKLAVLIITILASPILLAFKLFSSRKTNLALTAGFILVLKK